MITTSYLCFLTFIVYLSFQKSFAFQSEIPQAVVDYMATRKMRNHHFVWHNMREMWDLLSKEEQDKIRQYGWEPPRTSLQHKPNGEVVVLKHNGAGEDFLYMHRQLIKMVNKIAKRVSPNAGGVVGFETVPAPGDKTYPVPPIYEVPGKEFEEVAELIRETKTDEFYWNVIKPQEDQLNDKDYLRSLSLSELGAILEYEIHTYMHTRFSSKPFEVRPQPLDVPVPYIDKKWDDPKYNWLADFFSAHVNRLFWKIHGWVDNKLEQWKDANDLDEIPWQYTWEGGPGSTVDDITEVGEDDNKSHDHDAMNLEEVAKVLMGSGKVVSFYPKVKL